MTSMAGAVAALGDSGWLMHCHTILTGAAWIAARITLEGASVLVHCRYTFPKALSAIRLLIWLLLKGVLCVLA